MQGLLSKLRDLAGKTKISLWALRIARRESTRCDHPGSTDYAANACLELAYQNLLVNAPTKVGCVIYKKYKEFSKKLWIKLMWLEHG